MSELQSIKDVASGTVTYEGWSEIGKGGAEAAWRIKKTLVAGAITSYMWPTSLSSKLISSDLEFVWNDRASLVYGLAAIPVLTKVLVRSSGTDSSKAKVGDTITITFSGSVPLNTVTATIMGQAATVTQTDVAGKEYTAAFVMTSGQSAGTVTFSIAFKNSNGDAGVAVTASTDAKTVTFDKTAPTATLLYSLDAGENYTTTVSAKYGDTIRIKATFTETLLDSPVVTISFDKQLSTHTMEKTSGTVYYYDVEAPTNALSETITCSLGIGTDAAGNVVTATPTNATFIIDNIAPIATLTYTSPSVKLGATQTITANFDTPLADSPVIKIALSGGQTLAATAMTKVTTQQYTYTRVIGAGDGVTTCTLSVGKDVAGNLVSATPVNPTFIVDNVAPIATLQYSIDAGETYSDTIVAVSTDTLRIKATFDTPLADSPVVKIAIDNGVLAATAMTKVTTTEYTYDLNVPTGYIAVATCSMSVGTDVAGNVITTVPVNPTFEIANVLPAMLSGERLSNTTLKVTLTENANDATITKANAGGFVVKDTVTPATTYAVSAIAKSGSNSNMIEITVASVLASAATGVTITYVAGGNGTVADPEGNLMLTDATGVAVAPWA